MFVPSDQACSIIPNSSTSHPEMDAAQARAIAQYDNAKMQANQVWLGLLSRNWQSFASQGPDVAMQLRNSPTDDWNRSSLLAGVVLNDPVVRPSGSGAGVAVVSDGNLNGGNPIAGGAGGNVSSLNGTPVSAAPGGLADSVQFVKTFGVIQPFVQTYTGPLPAPGSAMSLVVGGQNRALPTGGGVVAAGTPFGRRGACRSHRPVDMIPLDRPAFQSQIEAVSELKMNPPTATASTVAAATAPLAAVAAPVPASGSVSGLWWLAAAALLIHFAAE